MDSGTNSSSPLKIAIQSHGRQWHDFTYCYPVISRRSGGLSVGINLNPDKACNFDCIYCQVDRSTPGTARKVDLGILKGELDTLLDRAMDHSLFAEAPFDCLPADRRRVCDIAFSGDGEPTTCPVFEDAVRVAAEARRNRGLAETRLVLITDACYLKKDNVRAGLKILDENNGEIWAKLDAGTEQYYRLVNRPNYELAHVMENIMDAARIRPVVIQSLWMRVHGEPPPRAEVEAYCGRLNDILSAGGALKLIQLYTIARRTAEAYATPLADAELDAIADRVRSKVSSPVETYYGVSS